MKPLSQHVDVSATTAARRRGPDLKAIIAWRVKKKHQPLARFGRERLGQLPLLIVASKYDKPPVDCHAPFPFAVGAGRGRRDARPDGDLSTPTGQFRPKAHPARCQAAE
jgi:hypothetical protein